ncbi:DUF4834 family protein [Bacteroides sp. 51]|uniref:DUF4834 family protein n=1 Tax=Bacteroides sp. 51 TaxID=2302938 RepID=UPI0013D3BF2A|nr:DUF4834 family protein [Bacteroides sp. 51]NDV83053.1 DUF4834 family protein [Bacteroides sp. 51]
MLSFLGFIFFFVLIIIVFGLTIISGVLRALFGFGKRNSSNRSTSSSDGTSHSTHENKKGNAQDTPKRKKLFDDDEGEYVDFEETE